MKNILFVILTMFLTNCAVITPHERPPINTTPDNPARQAFAVSGAIAAKNQRQAWTATFYWTQNSPQNYHITIYGLVGNAVMDITNKNGMITYREGKKILHAKQAEDLLAKETGIRIPVRHLYYWIKGQPAPGAIEKIARSPEQDIIFLQQAGFVLTYTDYRNHYPHKIRLQGQQLMVKIVIKEWTR